MSQSTIGQEEIIHLRSQNDQLWKIIEKQRIMIQNLQKDAVILASERDSLRDQLAAEREITRKATSLFIAQPIDEDSPMPPPRSPYRIKDTKTDDFHSIDGVVNKNMDEFHGRSSPVLPAPTLKKPSPTASQSSGSARARQRPEYTRQDSSATDHVSTYNNNNMSNISVNVIGSTIKPNSKGKEVVTFIISVGSPDLNEHWRVEKLYSDFIALDTKLKTQRNKSMISRIGKLPDKALFSNNAPTKVDQRKIALEHYLQQLISLPLEDNSELCEFLSTNVVDAKTYQVSGQREGYLTKRGKNFGGWKTRYFILTETALEYYESKDGIQLGSIRLTSAQIGKQMQPSNEDSNSVYRHAFLIVEQKKAGSTSNVRHILCASSDEDRDSWVTSLLNTINQLEEEEKASERPKERPTLKEKSKSFSDDHSYSPSVSSDSDISGQWSTSVDTTSRSSLDHRQVPTPRIVRRNSMGNLISEEPLDESAAEKKSKNKAANRMTFWGKKMFTEDPSLPPRPSQSSSATTTSSVGSTGLRGFLSRSSHEQNERRHKSPVTEEPSIGSNQVFGVPLEEAVRISRVVEGYELPAIVYRCIEYLDAMQAVTEEGIYRLSGSNATMKALRDRFNQEGDVKLLASPEEYDVHVVAGLLKMWLRELPTSVLTREHRVEFLHVIDLLDRKDRVNELGRLMSVLPLANYTLLRALTAHLIRVVQHSDINKMTMRNVSIVFSPTLGIPATIFNLLMSEFDYIFWTTKDGKPTPRRIEDEEESEKVQRDSVEQVDDVIVDNQQFEGISKKPALFLREEHGRNNRNSVNYMDGAPHAIVDLEKNMEDGQPLLDEDDDNNVDDLNISNESNFSLHS